MHKNVLYTCTYCAKHVYMYVYCTHNDPHSSTYIVHVVLYSFSLYCVKLHMHTYNVCPKCMHVGIFFKPPKQEKKVCSMPMLFKPNPPSIIYYWNRKFMSCTTTALSENGIFPSVNSLCTLRPSKVLLVDTFQKLFFLLNRLPPFNKPAAMFIQLSF